MTIETMVGIFEAFGGPDWAYKAQLGALAVAILVAGIAAMFIVGRDEGGTG